jgi:hypothetical protein
MRWPLNYYRCAGVTDDCCLAITVDAGGSAGLTNYLHVSGLCEFEVRAGRQPVRMAGCGAIWEQCNFVIPKRGFIAREPALRLPKGSAFRRSGLHGHGCCAAVWRQVSDKLRTVAPKADVAQLVEQSIRNRQVIGSSPIVGSILSATANLSPTRRYNVWRPHSE